MYFEGKPSNLMTANFPCYMGFPTKQQQLKICVSWPCLHVMKTAKVLILWNIPFLGLTTIELLLIDLPAKGVVNTVVLAELSNDSVHGTPSFYSAVAK